MIKKNPNVNKDQTTNVVLVVDSDTNEEPIIRTLDPRIAKRLQNMKGKVVESSNNLKKSQKSYVARGRKWSKVEISTCQKKSVKRKKVVSSDSKYEEDI